MVFSPRIARKIAQESARAVRDKIAKDEVARQASRKTPKTHRKTNNPNQPLSNSSKVKVREIKRLKKITKNNSQANEMKLASWRHYTPKTPIDWDIRNRVMSGEITPQHGDDLLRIEMIKQKSKTEVISNTAKTIASKPTFLQPEIMSEGQRIKVGSILASDVSTMSNWIRTSTAKAKKLTPKERKQEMLKIEALDMASGLIPMIKVGRSKPKPNTKNTRKSPFEFMQRIKEHSENTNKGALKDGHFRTPTKRIDGEQSFDPEFAKQWKGIGLGLGGAGTLGGGLAYSGDKTKNRPGTPNYGNYFG